MVIIFIYRVIKKVGYWIQYMKYRKLKFNIYLVNIVNVSYYKR